MRLCTSAGWVSEHSASDGQPLASMLPESPSVPSSPPPCCCDSAASPSACGSSGMEGIRSLAQASLEASRAPAFMKGVPAGSFATSLLGAPMQGVAALVQAVSLLLLGGCTGSGDQCPDLESGSRSKIIAVALLVGTAACWMVLRWLFRELVTNSELAKRGAMAKPSR